MAKYAGWNHSCNLCLSLCVVYCDVTWQLLCLFCSEVSREEYNRLLAGSNFYRLNQLKAVVVLQRLTQADLDPHRLVSDLDSHSLQIGRYPNRITMCWSVRFTSFAAVLACNNKVRYILHHLFPQIYFAKKNICLDHRYYQRLSH